MEKVLSVSDRTCWKWFVKFHAADFSLDDALGWLGRPVEGDSDQIETLIENNQCSPDGRQLTYSKYQNQ